MKGIQVLKINPNMPQPTYYQPREISRDTYDLLNVVCDKNKDKIFDKPTHRYIESIIKGFDNQKLNSYDLSKMFNLNRADIDASVIQNVRNLTNELNALAKEALKTNSDSSWEGIVNKISSLSKVLSQFGSSRDLSAFKESLDVLDYFQNKKISRLLLT